MKNANKQTILRTYECGCEGAKAMTSIKLINRKGRFLAKCNHCKKFISATQHVITSKVS